MKKNLYLIKIKTGQIWNSDGKRLAVTTLLIPKTVMLKQLSKDEKWQTIQVGIKSKPLAKCKQPQRQFLAKLGLKNGFYYIKNITIPSNVEFVQGQSLDIGQVIKAGDPVMASGTMKGRGFAGVVKRWGFRGGPKTHGQSDRWRAIGSIGQRTDPGRVRKGKKMPGHMGAKTKTIGVLRVAKIDPDNNTLLLIGLVPGTKGTLISLSKKDSIKSKKINLWQADKDSSQKLDQSKSDMPDKNEAVPEEETKSNVEEKNTNNKNES